MSDEIFDNIEQEIKELIERLTGKRLQELGSDKDLWKDIGIDSIKAIEISVALERMYKIKVRDEQLPKIATIADIVTVVKEALSKKQNET